MLAETENQVKISVSWNDKDLEYLEAACMLHNIGLVNGEKGYHKQSQSIIRVHVLSFFPLLNFLSFLECFYNMYRHCRIRTKKQI